MPATKAILTLSFGLLIAACGPGGGSSSISPTGAAEATPAASVKRQPGSWTMVHYTMTYDAENVEGGMAEMVKAGKASIGQKDIGGPLCLSAEMAGKDDLTVRLNEAIRLGNGYRVIRSELNDGKVDFAAVREDPMDGKSELTITGTLTATTTDLIVTTDAWQPAPGKGHIRTVMKQENSRVGDCLPGQDSIQ